MDFRTSEHLQRNELVRFQLDDVLIIISIKNKIDTNLQLMTDLHFSIGIMDTLKFVFSYK